MLIIYLALIDEQDEKELFKQIYKTNYKLIYKTVFSILKNHSLTDEAVQETLLSIAKHISLFTSADSNKTAALTVVIARNKAISLQRKEKSERGADTINIEDIDYELPAVSDDITVKENYNQILNVIKSMEHIYSDVIIMKYVYEFENKTIADILGVSIKTVDSRLYRGKKYLAAKLEEYDEK